MNQKSVHERIQEVKGLESYRVIQENDLPEVNGKGLVLEHIRTKARVSLVLNDDRNKVFFIGFRTPPENSKGIQHIIEHTVLCGSRKYPAKDPFIELAKGSLNTFLNAMTYPDKTVYPIASCNDQDYHNLMDVYLDAVFHPNIYSRPEIFQQEGWHYEIEEPQDPLTINGVVYNEMRGVYSSPESVLGYAVNRSLFPDTVYSENSGGDPDVIPTLTREEYLRYHKTYYHPSNSYLYLYGNVDAAKELSYIDEEYLSRMEYQTVSSRIPLQKKPDSLFRTVEHYSVSGKEPVQGHTYLTYNVVIGENENQLLQTALAILGYVLTIIPGAPLKEKMVNAGICSDLDWNLETSLRQPYLTILARDSDPEKEDEFVRILEDTLTSLVKTGLDQKTLSAAISHFEFQKKEADFGRIPKGLSLGLSALDTWLYDDDAAQNAFTIQPVFDEMKKRQGQGFFEGILQKYILENPHKSIISCEPERGLNERKDAELKEKLARKKASLSQAEISNIMKVTAHLKAYQMAPSSEEDLQKIPLLSLSDIDGDAQQLKNEVTEKDGMTVVHHDIFTNGISYLSLRFPVDDLDTEELKILGLITELLEEVDTDSHSYLDLSNEVDIETGSLSFDLTSTTGKDRISHTDFIASLKVLDEKLETGLGLLEEILFTSHLTDPKRIREIVREIRSAGKDGLVENGHITALRSALSYISESAALSEETGGIGFYRFTDNIDRNFDEVYPILKEKILAVLAKVLKKEGVIASFTSSLSEETLRKALQPLISHCSGEPRGKRFHPALSLENTGYTAATRVNYAAVAGDYRKNGLTYRGELNVLQTIFSYEYLWTNIRVLGGAYGCMCGFGRSGYSYFASYRDPHMKRTLDVFQKVPDYVKNFTCSDRDMTKYIIGTIARLDQPMSPSAEGSFSFTCWRTGVTQEDLQRERTEVLTCTQRGIQNLAPYMENVLSSGAVSALGSEEKIREDAACFGRTESLLGEKDGE